MRTSAFSSESFEGSSSSSPVFFVAVLERYSKRYLMIKEDSRKDAIDGVKEVISSFDSDSSKFPPNNKQVYEILDLTLFSDLLEVKSLVFVQDLGDDDQSDMKVHVEKACIKVWVSSPNEAKLHRPFRECSLYRMEIFFPRWSLEEIRFINQNLFNNRVGDSKKLEDLFDKFGGIPRTILSSKLQYIESEYLVILNNISLDDLKKMFSSQSFTNLPKGFGMIIHPIPDEDDDSKFHCIFASDQVSRDLFSAMVQRSNFDLLAFHSAVSSTPGLATFLGTCLDVSFHGPFRGGGDFQMRKLGSRSNSSKFETVRFPRIVKMKYFRSVNFEDITLPEGEFESCYFQPPIKTFPTIDSFAILPESIFKPGSKRLCIASNQATVSKTHVMNGTILNRLRKRVLELFGNRAQELFGENPILYHLWISGPNGIQTAQTPKQDNEKPFTGDQRIEQYVVLLGNAFDSFFNQLFGN